MTEDRESQEKLSQQWKVVLSQSVRAASGIGYLYLTKDESSSLERIPQALY